MADKTATYECFYIINTALGEENIKALVEKFTALIESLGTLESVDEWGNRRLAYPIDDLTEGYYVLSIFTSGPDAPAELERVFKITDGILRSLIVHKQ